MTYIYVSTNSSELREILGFSYRDLKFHDLSPEESHRIMQRTGILFSPMSSIEMSGSQDLRSTENIASLLAKERLFVAAEYSRDKVVPYNPTMTKRTFSNQ